MVAGLRWLGPVAAAVLAATGLTACTTSGDDEPPPAPAASRPWPGRLIVATLGTDQRGAVLEIVHDGAGGARVARRLATTAGGAAALSHDGGTLLFLAESGPKRLEVATDTLHPIEARVDGIPVRITNECFRFAPGGQRFLVKDADGRLLAVGTDGVAVLVDEPKRENYVEPGGTRSTEAVSTVDCGRWLDDQRIVFDHVRTMPPSLPGNEMTGARVSLPAGDTALAVLTAAGARLVESVTPWRVVGTCGSWTLTRRGGDAYSPDTFLWSGVPEQALAVDKGTTPDAGLIRGSAGMDAYAPATFLPSCDVFVVARAKESADRLAFRRVNPGTGGAVDSPQTLPAAEGVPRLEPDGFAWSPGAEPAMYAEISDRFSDRLYVTEVTAGLAATVTVPEAARIVAVLGWLP